MAETASFDERAAVCAYWEFVAAREPRVAAAERCGSIAELREHVGRSADAGVTLVRWFELLRGYREQAAPAAPAPPTAPAPPAPTVSNAELVRFLQTLCETTALAYVAANEARMAAAEARYRDIFDHCPMPMWTYDVETLRFVTVNEAAIRHYGYTADEFAAMTLLDLRPAEDAEALRADVARARGFEPASVWRHRMKDGTTISVEVRANDYRAGGRALRLVLVTDITDRLRAEQALQRTEDQLRHAQKMEALGRLAGGVAHDFNNILTVVQSYASMLEESIEPSDPRHQDAVEIRRASERATAITRHLLTMSRQHASAPRAIDLDEVVDEFRSMLRRLVGDRVTIETFRGRPPRVFADPGQLEQVLMNLAVNARDAMPEGGTLTIESRSVFVDDETAALRGLRPGVHAELAVTDTGIGMDPETQRRMFDPFFTTKEVGKGTGLGLAMVHGIVTQAGGAIVAYSERGHGTTFRIQLPATTEEGTIVEPPRIEAPSKLPELRVLVVDDETDVRTVASRILRESGCHVIEAATAQHARQIVVQHEEPIDVVVLDVVLSDGRGEQLVHELRALRPTARFVLTSGFPANALAAASSAPDALLPKPFSPNELRGAIARACGNDRAEVPPEVATPPRRRVLIADDDELFRRSVVRLLQRAGFETVQVCSGSAAIAELESSRFDVIVSDVEMPDGGGLDLLRAVRRIDLDVPVLLMTGAPSVAAASSAVEYGAFRYLTKPLDQTFVKTVERAVRAHALARVRREASTLGGVHAGVADRAGLEVRFEQAIDTLWVAFQPIVYARNGAPFGVEALVRSREPSLPNPCALLDAATALGRLPLVGRKVRELAGSALARRGGDLALFVNLHPEDLHDADLVRESSALAGVAQRVILEVTERASLEMTPQLAQRLEHLRELGFRIAVDDIGAGYSGLTSFTELMPEVVKLDMSLVRDIHKSVVKQRTIAALCRLCSDVGTLVVGEGVETVEERDVLCSLGCDLLQGYLIGRPGPDLP